MLSFGVTALPDPPYTRLVEVFQNGERHGRVHKGGRRHLLPESDALDRTPSEDRA